VKILIYREWLQRETVNKFDWILGRIHHFSKKKAKPEDVSRQNWDMK